MSQMGIRFGAPSLDIHALSANPLLTGGHMLSLRLLMEQLGIALANYWLTPLNTSYLYNSLQQEKVLPGLWPELETFMDIHTDSLFFGSRPLARTDSFKRNILRSGFTPSKTMAFYRAGRMGGGDGPHYFEGSGGDCTNKKGISPSCLSITATSKMMGTNFYGKEVLFALFIR